MTKNHKEEGSNELQALLQANRDLAVRRSVLGEVTILHALRNGDLRRVEVIVRHEKEGNPTVLVIGQQLPASYRAETHAALAKVRQKDHTPEDDAKYEELNNRRYDALRTRVEVRIAEDEQIHTKVMYQKEEPPEGLTIKINPFALITTAKRGLEVLQTYVNDPHPKFWIEQIQDEYRPSLDSDITEASPLLGNFMRREGISYTDFGTQASAAFNVLSKVTEAMLPQHLPKQRRKTIRRTQPPV